MPFSAVSSFSIWLENFYIYRVKSDLESGS